MGFRPFRTPPREYQSLRLSVDEYCRCGFGSRAESHVANFPIVRNVGVGMIPKTSPNGKDHVLSLLIHIQAPIQGTRMREQCRPVMIKNALSPLTFAHRILLMGGIRLWKHRNIEEPFARGAWWDLAPRGVWGCLTSDTLTQGGAANGGLAPPSDCYGDPASSTPSSMSREFRTGGRDNPYISPAPKFPMPRRSPDSPQPRNVAFGLYLQNREHIPFADW